MASPRTSATTVAPFGRVGPRLDDDDVAVEDAVVDHRVAPHAQREGLAAAEQLLGQRDRLGRLDRLDRRARPPRGRGAARWSRRRGAAPVEHLERAALMRAAADDALPLEASAGACGRWRATPSAEVPADLLERRRVAVPPDVRLQEVEQLLLPPRHHAPLIGKEKTNLKVFLRLDLAPRVAASQTRPAGHA